MLSYFILLTVFLPALIGPVVPGVSGRNERLAGWLTALPVAVSGAILAWMTVSLDPRPSEVFEFRWIPSLDVNVTFLVDGLSLFFGLIICGIGLLVCWYASQYLEKSGRELGRFYAFLLVFITSMLGAVLSNNLLLLFVFWELTGVASFLLIGYWHTDEEARAGARRALLTTAATGLALLVGIVMIGIAAGTYSLRELTTRDWSAESLSTPWMSGALVLVALGIFGKSAQFPFHFWLPGAMAAPTPVSAFLHSATMVKLGVFLAARVFPIFGEAELWLYLLGTTGFVTMLLGAWLSLRSNDLKALLAYSTISQLGLLVGFYGIGGAIGVRLDFLHIVSHVFYKAALFMVAGIVDHSTGVRDVRRLGGLGRRMPLTAITGGIGAAALAGIPLTTGFLSKETLLAELALLRESHPIAGWLFLAMTVVSAVLTVTVAARFFVKVFLGSEPQGLDFHRPSWAIQAPPFLLACGVVLFGTFPGLLQRPLDHLVVSGLQETTVPKVALWHGFNTELFISLGVFATAALLYTWAERTQWRWTTIPRWIDFATGFDKGLDLLIRFSKKLTLGLRADWPPAYLPIVIAFLLIAVSVDLVTTFPGIDSWNFSPDWSVHPIRALVAALIIVAMFGVVFLRRWSSQLVALSIAGFFITLYFVLYQAPDLAMTQILVESASVVLILLLLSRFPSSSQAGAKPDFGFGLRHGIRLVLSVGVGLLMTGLILYAGVHRHTKLAGEELLTLSKPLADGTNAVNTILVDFRGFDTLGEITVLLIATLGGLGLMMRYKRREDPEEAQPPPGFALGEETRR